MSSGDTEEVRPTDGRVILVKAIFKKYQWYLFCSASECQSDRDVSY